MQEYKDEAYQTARFYIDESADNNVTLPFDVMRRLSKVGEPSLPGEKSENLTRVMKELGRIYGEGTVCIPKDGEEVSQSKYIYIYIIEVIKTSSVLFETTQAFIMLHVVRKLGLLQTIRKKI